jgi:tRNA modification GTPase
MGLKDFSQDPILISERQKDIIEISKLALKKVLNLIENKAYPEIIASDLNQIKDCLEEIVGKISVDDIYESLFSSFCIGK